MSKVSNMNWVSRTIARLKGGDEGNLIKMQSETSKFIAKQIAAKQSQIEELTEKSLEHAEALNEYLETPNTEIIKSIDSRKSYIPTFINDAFTLMNKVEEIHEEIAELELEIERLQAIADKI